MFLLKQLKLPINCLELFKNIQSSRQASFLSTTARRNHADTVRVRFAPSPTGHIHLGGLRAALYNYIYARKYNGQFVLRIEDTDQARQVAGSSNEIEDVLEWAGIAPDESPRKAGNYGPYEQSKRLNLYQQHAELLIASGKAYKCFCSPTRLELLRKFQARNREKTRYDGKCKHLTNDEIEEKIAETGNKFTVRFSLVDNLEYFDDLVFGRISTNLVENQESDPIILKSDGYPTYHFANVIDDHLMKISHVLRGSEWLSSTIKHIQLYKAFDWNIPRFVHLPLVTMEDGTKMSKRNNHNHVSSWIEAGYHPETLFNFLTNSGGGVPKWKQDSNEFWTLQDLINGFEFDKLTCHPGRLDLDRLRIYSAKELQLAWKRDRLAVVKRFHKLMLQRQIVTDLEPELIESIIDKVIDRLNSLGDLLSTDYVYIWKKPKLTWSKDHYLKLGWDLEKVVSDIIEQLSQNVDVENKDEFLNSMKALANKHELQYSQLMQLIRRLLTNEKNGLPVHDVCICLGRTRLIEYLESGLDYVRS